MARLIFGRGDEHSGAAQSDAGGAPRLIAAGINDWGGVSPVTPDHVNPEAPWPALDQLARRDRKAPARSRRAARDLPGLLRGRIAGSTGLAHAVLAHADAEGFARTDGWMPGSAPSGRRRDSPPSRPARDMRESQASSTRGAGRPLTKRDRRALFSARGTLSRRSAPPPMRYGAEQCGERVSYVVTATSTTRTSAIFVARFCAFSKGKRTRICAAGPTT